MICTDGGSWAKGCMVVQVLKFQMQMSAVCYFLLWRNSTRMCSKLGAYHKAIKGNMTITKVGVSPQIYLGAFRFMVISLTMPY